MIPALGRWMAENGMKMPTLAELIQIGVLAALAALAMLIGWSLSRRYGTRAAALWKAHIGGQVEGIGDRLDQILGHGITAILLALIAHGWPWPYLGQLLIGLMLGYAVMILSLEILRGLSLPRWAAWSVALVVFVAILAKAVGGLERIQLILSEIGFDVGRTRVSLLSVTVFAVTAVVLMAGIRLANRVVTHAIGRAKGLDPTQKLLFQKLSGIAIVIFAIFFGIDLLGIDLTSLTVFSGGVGLAVGFGLQKTVGNLIAGIILLMDRSIKPGDVIVVGDSFGQVNKIGVRAVSVITRDGKEHLIPNENLMTEEVENWSYSDKNVRVRVPVGVAYSSDLKLAQELMLRAAKESPRVLTSPKPNVWLTDFGDSAVNHEILCWINDPEGGVGNVRSDVLNRLWFLFKEHGIEIPFPQQDVWVKSLPGGE